jgi:hypothetical protein
MGILQLTWMIIKFMIAAGLAYLFLVTIAFLLVIFGMGV